MPYPDFIAHLAPVAMIGLLLNWALIVLVFGVGTEAVAVPVVDRPRLFNDDRSSTPVRI